jgi:hypothetical protein
MSGTDKACEMEYSTLSEARERAELIRAAFDSLLDSRTLARKRNARQWMFLCECLERTLRGGTGTTQWSSTKLAQYKFEVEDKLRRYYLRGGAKVAFVLRLVHRREAERCQLTIDDAYPETDGYLLLIRGRRDDPSVPRESPAATRAYIEKVVAACVDAEFAAYVALPMIDESRLWLWFDRSWPALRDLIHTLTQLAKRGSVLTNPRDPSTKRIIAIDVKELRDDSAVVRTTEYWYLRCWSKIEQSYRYPYRETNRQTYVLARRGDDWLVEENIRPAPRSSTPHRQK